MKRFSDTSRFSEPWYSELPPEMKVAWEYIWATCDNSGVWTPNYPLADFQIGKKVDWQKLKTLLAGKVSELKSGKWFLPDFIKTQCGKLNPESRPHMAVITLLRGHGLMSKDSFEIDYCIDYQRTIDSPQDKDKDQDKEKEKEKDTAPKKNKATLDEVIAFAKEIGLPESDGASCFHKWEGNGWTNGKAKIVCWKSTMRAWKAAGYLPSQKVGGFTQPAPKPRSTGIKETPMDKLLRENEEMFADGVHPDKWRAANPGKDYMKKAQ
jgi:hypothetical protein